MNHRKSLSRFLGFLSGLLILGMIYPTAMAQPKQKKLIRREQRKDQNRERVNPDIRKDKLASFITQRHYAAMGGYDALRNTRTRHMVGTMNLLGKPGKIEVHQMAPNKKRTHLRISGPDIIEVCNGEQAWRAISLTHTKVTEIQGNELKDKIRDAAFHGPTSLLRNPDVRIHRAGDGSAKRSEFHILVSGPAKVLVSKRTFLISAIKIPGPDGKEITIDYDHYRKVSGLMVAHAYRVMMDEKEVFKVKFNDIDHNVRIDENHFRKPAVGASAKLKPKPTTKPTTKPKVKPEKKEPKEEEYQIFK